MSSFLGSPWQVCHSEELSLTKLTTVGQRPAEMQGRANETEEEARLMSANP